MRVRQLVIGGSSVLLLGLALTLTRAPGTASIPATNATVEDLLAADRAFAAAAAADGLEGWMSYMTDDTARMPVFGMEFVSGDAAIRAADGPLLDSPERLLTWNPEHGHLFADGRHGFTSGTYEIQQRADGASLGRGRYLTFWRLTEVGWKVAFDTGVAAVTP